jgi:hypothetical protein
VVSRIAGAWTSSRPVRQARMDPHRGVSLDTNARDDPPLAPQELWASSKGPSHAARGLRFWKAPPCFAASLYLKKPARLMALRMVMTVCFLGDAALESRLRQARKTPQAPVPEQQGKPVQNPTARWVFPSCVGMHLLRVSGQWPLV